MEQINILVVDDDKEIAELVEIHLVGDGFRVFKAYDGHEAMRVMEKEKIMLAVLDIMMPGMSGIELCQRIREKSNIPIIMLGMWKFGFRFIVSTFYTIAATSIFTNIFARFGAATDDILLAALAGSVLIAISIGVIFKRGATTGGTDIIVKCLRLKYPHLKTGSLFFIMDLCIVSLSGIVFRNIDSALYAGISVVVTAVVLDMVLYGTDEAKLVYIISDCQVRITDRLLEELDIGVTRLSGEGAFSGNKKKIIMCVVHKPLAPKVEEIVKEEDADAFMIVTSATEIFGEGYKSYFGEKF